MLQLKRQKSHACEGVTGGAKDGDIDQVRINFIRTSEKISLKESTPFSRVVNMQFQRFGSHVHEAVYQVHEQQISGSVTACLQRV